MSMKIYNLYKEKMANQKRRPKKHHLFDQYRLKSFGNKQVKKNDFFWPEILELRQKGESKFPFL